MMLVANPFVHDTRVYKQAKSLVEWGCEVHVIAVARKDLPTNDVQDGIFIHRVRLDKPLLRDVIMLPITLLLLNSPRALNRVLTRQIAARQSASAATAETNPPHDPCRLRRDKPAASRSRSIPIRAIRRGRDIQRKLRKAMGDRARLGRARKRFTTFTRGLATKLTPQAARLVRLNSHMAEYARHLMPDVVQSHDLNTLLAGTYVKKLNAVPLLYDSHELYLERNIGGHSRFKDKLVWGIIERLCIHQCDASASVAESICQHLQKQYGIPKPHLIRNVQPYEPPAPKSHVLADELGIDRDRRLVIYPGAITINRGLEVLIDSAAYLENAAYIIMGYANDSAFLESLKQRGIDRGVLNSHVYFRDAVPIGDVLRYVASTDLGIVPTQNVCLSYFYESSNKIFHCMMAGVPLAMSDHAEKRLLVEEYDVGVLFDETNPRDIARKVNELLADPVRYERLRRNCLAAARNLNWQHEEHSLRTVYAELIGDRAPVVPPVKIPDAVDNAFEAHTPHPARTA